MTEQNPYQSPKSNVVVNANVQGTSKKRSIEEALASGYNFEIMDVIKDAWIKVNGAKLTFLGSSLFILVLWILSKFVVRVAARGGISIIAGSLFDMMISAVAAGFIVLTLKRLNGQSISFKADFLSIVPFSGAHLYKKLLLAIILCKLITMCGFLLIIIPGIYLLTAYCLTNWIIVDNPSIGIINAMEVSRKLVTQHWFKFFGLMFLLGIICGISAIPLGIGLIWTIPLYFLSLGTVYKKIFYAQ